MKALARHMIAACVLLVGLVAVAGYHAFVRSSGQIIALPVQTLDPLDPFLGYYATLQTPANRLAASKRAREFVEGQTVYLSLEADDEGLYQPSVVYRSRTEIPEGTVFLKGTVSFAFASTLTVRYGFERFYADARTASALDRILFQEGRLALLVSVTRSGEARLAGLRLDGEEYRLSLWQTPAALKAAVQEAAAIEFSGDVGVITTPGR